MKLYAPKKEKKNQKYKSLFIFPGEGKKPNSSFVSMRCWLQGGALKLCTAHRCL